MTVINMSDHRPNIAFRYQDGDICRALRLALEHDEISADIEETFSALLFEGGEEDAGAAQDLLFQMLEAGQ